MNDLRPVREYIRTIEKELALGNATEHTHRPALKALLESLGDGIVATNEPRRVECGAPDFVITTGSATIGYVEAKDVGKSLDEAEFSQSGAKAVIASAKRFIEKAVAILIEE